MDGELLTRFEAKYTPEPNSGCWLWIASCDTGGYGLISVNGRQEKAHRVAHSLFKGPIPMGRTVDHLCRVRCCVNPDHLEAVAFKENVLRGVGPTAQNSLKTHCPKGHLLSPDNLVAHQLRLGWRSCLECNRRHQREYQRRRRLFQSKG